MGLFGNFLKEYVDRLGIPMLIIFTLSIVQVVLSVFWQSFSFMGQIEISSNLYFLKYNLMNPFFMIEFFEFFVVFCFGFYLAKKKFKLRNNIVAGIVLYFSSIPSIFFIILIFPVGIQLTLKLFCIVIIFVTNFLFFILASVSGGIIGKLFLKLKD